MGVVRARGMVGYCSLQGQDEMTRAKVNTTICIMYVVPEALLLLSQLSLPNRTVATVSSAPRGCGSRLYMF